jgi:UDP-N-acetyl-D-glucosamine dehydrogenase
MPEWVINKVMHALNDQAKALKNSKILILGLAYKPDVDDDRESPSYKLMDLLVKRGAEVDYHDPHVPVIGHKREYPQYTGKKCVELSAESLARYDCVLVATHHSKVDYELVAANARLVVDTRNIMPSTAEHIVKA